MSASEEEKVTMSYYNGLGLQKTLVEFLLFLVTFREMELRLH
jgi:hypothetical protein